MEMHQIKYFLTVCDTLNFTRAAEHCNVAQPSLTRAIKKLEAELGGELFLRERSRTHVSDLGRTMLPLLTKSYNSAMAAKLQADQYKKAEIAHLRLGLSSSVDACIVMPALSELNRVLSDLEIHLVRGNAEKIEKRLEDGDIELAITANEEPAWARIDNWSLFSETFLVAMSVDHRLAKQGTVKLEHFAAQRVLMRTHCERETAIIAMLGERGLTVEHRHEVETEADHETLLQNGFGVGMVPNSIGLTKDGIIKIRLEDFELRRSLCLQAVAGRKYSKPAGLLIKLLRSADWSDYET